MSDIQSIETNDEQEHENKHKISSPPNEFILNSNYENSLESSYKKLNSDSTSLISSSSDNDSASEIDSFRSNITLKLVLLFYFFNNIKCLLVLFLFFKMIKNPL